MKRVSIDVGGTFTDCVVLDEGGDLREVKAPTTPGDPTAGLLRCLEKAAALYGRELAAFLGEVELLVHGTTLATNTLVTGRGARTGVITTEGFRDVIEMRRGLRPQNVSMYNLFIPPYRPLVPRYLRLGVPERVRYDCAVLTPLDGAAVRQAAEQLRREGVETVAVCFLHSYANPAHEQAAGEVCREVFPGERVTLSHEVLPVWREFERFSTAVVSAYLQPVVSDYLLALQERLRGAGFRGALLMMLASGLVQTPDQCLGRSVYLLGSGPAAAPSGALHLARDIGGDLISVDMGGTSFDICVVRGGEVPTTTEAWVGNHRVAIKMVDVRSVGAGGGSIAWIDSLGLLRVGPDSAGADPGPACYGRGAQAPTVTDADLVLGYVPADYFLGGEIALSEPLAREALGRLGERLGLGPEQAAEAVFAAVNSYMADQITEACTRQGYDVRDFTLVVGGGAGPVHGGFIARQLGLSTVLIPPVAALYSAFGMQTMDLGRDWARSYVARAETIDADAVDRLYREMEAEALASFGEIDVPAERVVLSRSAEMRYVGQFHEVEVPVAAGPVTAEALNRAVEELHRRHEALYTFSMPWVPAQFLTFRLRASAAHASFELREPAAGGTDPAPALRRTRPCRWDGQVRQTPVYDGRRLLAGNEIPGPAVIEEPTTTVVVPEGFTCTVDRRKNYVLRGTPGVAAPVAPVAERAVEEGGGGA